MRPSTLILAAAFSAALSTTVLAADPVTLVGWTLDSNAVASPNPAASERATGISPDSKLALGSCVTAKSTTGYGGSTFSQDAAVDGTFANGSFIDVSFAILANYEVKLSSVAYSVTASATGPRNLQWYVKIGEGGFSPVSDSFDNPASGNNTKNLTLDLSEVGNVASGTRVVLRLAAWGATGPTGTLYFKNSISITGTITQTEVDSTLYQLDFTTEGCASVETNDVEVSSPANLPARIPVVFTADEGKRLASVTTNDVAIANIDKSASSYTFVMVEGDASVEVVFATPPALTYTIEGGIASVNGEAISSPANLPAGTVVTFTADAGKKLSSVSIGGTPVEDIDTSATSYAYTMGDEEASLAVVFVEPPIEAIEICNGKTIAENFDSLGPAKATASSTLPSPWRVSSSDTAHDYSISYQAGTDSTTRSGGCDTSITYAGIYNFTTGQVDVASNRAVGFLSSDKACRTGLLAVPLKNSGTSTITELRMEYSVGKYKGNTRAKKIVLRLSDDGASWQECGDAFSTVFPADAAEEKYEAGGFPAPVKTYEYVKCRIEPGKTIFLGWFYDNAESTTGGDKPQALAVDDVRIRAGRPMCLILK